VGAIIDSGIFIASERGQLDIDQTLESAGTTAFAIAAITASELLVGVSYANEQKRAERFERVETILSRYRIVPFDEEVARIYAKLYVALKKAGRPIASHDLMVAATALHQNFSVITRDKRSFPHIPQLTVQLV
jgi:predicted nucleic acid-binding protein